MLPLYRIHKGGNMLENVIEYYMEIVFNDTVFLLYVTSLIVDIITGNILALKTRHWNSKTGINGTLRHLALLSVTSLLLPIISYTMGVGYVANGIMFYIISQYTISILENLSGMGLDLHEGFAKYFEYLNPDKQDNKQINKGGVEKNE